MNICICASKRDPLIQVQVKETYYARIFRHEEQAATAGGTGYSLGHQRRTSAPKEHAANTPQVRESPRGEAG
jgi:hypothetical protein